jgi:hypothetical protein
VSRPTDWSPVGLAHDPVPGDPETVRAGGKSYLDVAEAIDRTAAKMAALDSDGAVSQALDALVEQKKNVVDDVRKAHGRYQQTGQALVTYASALEQAQSDADAALARARTAAGDHDDAERSRRHYLSLSDDATDATEKVQYRNLATQHEGNAQQASSQVTAAQNDVQAASGDRDRAAETAKDDIQDFISHDGLKDGWWDNWGSKVVSAITDVAGWVSTIAGVLALAVCWIPVVGQAAAAVLLTVSAVAAAVEAIGNIVLAATGDRSWTDAIIAVAGAALACVGLGGTARIAARAITKGVLMREAKTGVTAAGKAAGWESGVAEQAETATKAFKGRHLLRLASQDPRAVVESSRGWIGALRGGPEELQTGDEVFRVYGNDSLELGGSWTTVDPRTLENPRAFMGLPKGNTMSGMVDGTVDNLDSLMAVRHGLPLDKMPGGAPEYLIRGGKGVADRTTAAFSVTR